MNMEKQVKNVIDFISFLFLVFLLPSFHFFFLVHTPIKWNMQKKLIYFTESSVIFVRDERFVVESFYPLMKRRVKLRETMPSKQISFFIPKCLFLKFWVILFQNHLLIFLMRKWKIKNVTKRIIFGWSSSLVYWNEYLKIHLFPFFQWLIKARKWCGLNKSTTTTLTNKKTKRMELMVILSQSIK